MKIKTLELKLLCSRLLLPLALLGLGISTGCSLFGIRGGYEEAGYHGVDTNGAIEIRDYEELVVVETVVKTNYDDAGNKAFRRLFKYISGNNVSKRKIAMTTPVIADQAITAPEQVMGDTANTKFDANSTGEKIAMTTPVMNEAAANGGWRYRFVLPASFTIDSAPLPKDPKVKLAVLPERKVAVLRYSGSWGEESMLKKAEELKAWISENNYSATSNPRIASYDPPWTIPSLRRNEIMIDIH